MRVTVSGLLIIALIVTSSLASLDRINPGAVVRKVEAPKNDNEQQGQKIQQPPPQAKEPVQRELSTATQATLYTSQGYVVRIMPPFQEKKAAIQPRKQQVTEPAKPVVSESPVYPVKRPDTVTTVYQGQPARPTITMDSPRPIATTNNIQSTNKPQLTGPANKAPTTTAKKDDDDDDDEEDSGGKGKGNDGDKKTTVQSGDPWGDFVFPTRGPRPNWMRNDSNSGNSVSLYNLLYLALPLLLFII